MAVRSTLVLIIAHLSSHLSSALSSTPSLLSGGFAARGAYLAARAREDAARAAKRAVFGDALAQLPVAGKRGLAAGSTVAVTSATSGVGLEVARVLAQLGYGVVLCGRSADKLAAASKDVSRVARGTVDTALFDLESLTETRAAAAALPPDVNGLILCAGAWPTTLRLTEDELEAGLQANHLSHFLLTTALLERGGVERVVAVSSSAHTSTRNDALDLDDAATWTARSFDALENYAQTKLMNALFARELPRRYPGLVAVSAHPGVVATELFRDFDVAPPPDPFGVVPAGLDRSLASFADGAASFLKAAVDAAPVSPFKKSRDAARDIVVGLLRDDVEPGAYLSDGEETPPSPGVDDAAAAALWDWSRSVVDDSLAAADAERADGEWGGS
mmetsp:Transcript_6751/g.21273  ORF Transcript_6751/g.21273 Transcript_6751/m.21273 type:complete len:389 (-) Transcript_6751:24-1190(-)